MPKHDSTWQILEESRGSLLAVLGVGGGMPCGPGEPSSERRVGVERGRGGGFGRILRGGRVRRRKAWRLAGAGDDDGDDLEQGGTGL